MNTPWWAVALAVGLVGMGAMWALTSGSGGEDGHDAVDGGSDGHSSTTAEPTPPVLLPFRSAKGSADAQTTYVLVAPFGQPAALTHLNRTGAGNDTDLLAWQSPSVALLTLDNEPSVASACTKDLPPSSCTVPAAWPLPVWAGDGHYASVPHLFEAGYNATRVTAYIFDEEGLLLASNANDTKRFELHGDFIRLPSSAWYLGANKTAPNGTVFLPSLAKPLVDKVRPLLDGLPEGGVASTRSNAYVNLYGSLFVTVRIDELVHAP